MATNLHYSQTKMVQVFCNGAPLKKGRNKDTDQLSLEYLSNKEHPQNVTLKLQDFIVRVDHLPDRFLDLLEIASYVFCADRYTRRGKRDDLEYHSWSREFEYFIKVRDADFWNSEVVKNSLSEVLRWISGDRKHSFQFLPGHTTNKAGLFDNKGHSLAIKGRPRVILFSGGLDSLAGIVQLLETTTDPIYPISHRSLASTVRTQRNLLEALQSSYPERIKGSFLNCNLHGYHAPEETQRTRAFLYCSMGLAMAKALEQCEFYVFENGVTALNFAKREGMMNARASRTVHPKTIRLLQHLFSLVMESEFKIKTPFANKTKTEVFEIIKKYGRVGLINSSVSCSKTYKELGPATHCGCCSQCIDRRFAAYASECDSYDEGGIYAFDFINQSITDGETKTGIIDYIRQAYSFLHSNIDNFHQEYARELTDAIDLQLDDEFIQLEHIHSLCNRHGSQIQRALSRMDVHLENYPEGSLHTLISMTDFKRPPVYLLAEQLQIELEDFIRKAFPGDSKPKDENDLNAKISGYLSGHNEKFIREHPSIRFATARTVPDHSTDNHDLLIEAKYIRRSTTPSKATEGIAADLTKYPNYSLTLFIVYDPYGQIADRKEFKRDFEEKSRCLIHII